MTLCNWQVLVRTEDLPAPLTSWNFRTRRECETLAVSAGLGWGCSRPYVGPLRRKHPGSSSNTRPSGSSFCHFLWQRWASSCRNPGSLWTILYCSLLLLWGSWWGPEDRTAAQVSGRTIDLPPKGKCILISLRVSLAAAGCGQELVFQQRQEDVQLL